MPLFYFASDGSSSSHEDAAIQFPSSADATPAAARALVEHARDSLIAEADVRDITIDVLDAEKILVARTRLVLDIEAAS